MNTRAEATVSVIVRRIGIEKKESNHGIKCIK